MRKGKLTGRWVARNANDTLLQRDLHLLLQPPSLPSGHLSHLSPNTGQMPTFFKTHHILLCLYAPVCIPHARNSSHPTIFAQTALASPTKARLHVFSPVKPPVCQAVPVTAFSVFHQHLIQALFQHWLFQRASPLGCEALNSRDHH